MYVLRVVQYRQRNKYEKSIKKEQEKEFRKNKTKTKPVQKKFSGPGAHPVPYIRSTGSLSRG
jgi:hypothetical protein